jgi:hypothetical protein
MASTAGRLSKLEFVPGFHRESTQYAEEGKWYDGNRVRFREGKPENMRGYEKAVNDTPFTGIARDLITWSDNDTKKLMSFGTEKFLYVVDSNQLYDSTPFVSATTLTSVMNTQLNSPLVSISITNHGVSVNDRIFITSATSIGGSGILLSGEYSVVAVGSLNTFTISATTSALAAVTDGGTADIEFILPVENTVPVQGTGYGAGTYNAGVSTTNARAWNRPAATGAITFKNSQWSLDNWGEDMVACRRGGKIFYLNVDASITPERAVVVSAAPSINNYIRVSPNDRHLIAYGSNEFGTGDYNPMLVRWSDQENFNDWTPSINSTSGEVILTGGTEIRGAIRSRNAINIWTDNAMYTQQFVGPPFIFNFQQVGTNCGLIAPHAAVDVDGIAYWMGENNFYAFDGRVRNLDCPVRRYLYDSFNMVNKDKVFAGTNSEFNEIIWLYCSQFSTEPDSYIIYNYKENHWVFGSSFYSTFADKVIYDNTIATGQVSATAPRYVWNNEPSNEYKGDGQILPSYLESAEFDIEDGNNILFIDRIIPDYTITNNGSVELTLQFQEYPNSPIITKGPYTVQQTTKKVDLRGRGRQAKIIVSASSDGSWRWGSVRANIQPDGMR